MPWSSNATFLVEACLDGRSERVRRRVGILHAGHGRIRHVQRRQRSMAESGDAGIAFAVVALAAGGGPPHQLDVVARGILEGDEVPHMTQFRVCRGTQSDMMAEPLKLRSGSLQIRALGNLERRGLIGRGAIEIAQRVLALVAAKIPGSGIATRELEAENARRVAAGADATDRAHHLGRRQLEQQQCLHHEHQTRGARAHRDDMRDTEAFGDPRFELLDERAVGERPARLAARHLGLLACFLRFLEHLGVLDRDHRLVGEGLDDADLMIREQP